MIGNTFAHYEIEDLLGAGGMGEVYRARDTKLNRDVALKVLPEAFSQDAERMARFEREAQVLASLNHPNIASIYGLEESDGTRALVMELVEGLTLADRIVQGPIPLEEALSIAKQIAEALESAHEKGIIHRDLKPANVKVTPDGLVKVLDFGLAKALEGDATDPDQSKSPTIAAFGTQVETILGTSAYVSPEQARGAAVDKRSDIWAFGVVLYEMLTGKQTFGGETVQDTLAAVLRAEIDWNSLPEETPVNLRRLIQRCVERDRKRRLHDIGDARIEIEELLSAPFTYPMTPRSSAAPRWMQLALWAFAAFAMLAVGVAIWSLRREPAAAPGGQTRFSIQLPKGLRVASVALSPDGTRIVYWAFRLEGGGSQLYLRPMDQLEARPIPGTENGHHPFFSPDGKWLGFFQNSRMKRIQVTGGTPLTLYEEVHDYLASWATNDTVLFHPKEREGIWQVSSGGGPGKPLTTLAQGELNHSAPQGLPGGEAILFTVQTEHGNQVAVQSLETGRKRVLVERATFPWYSPTGHLLFKRRGRLLAIVFDLDRLEAAGSEVAILEDVLERGRAYYSISNNGSLLYVPADQEEARRALLWVDRAGKSSKLTAISRGFKGPRLSPDGRQLAVTIESPTGSDVWVYEIKRDIWTRFTLEGDNYEPVWTPDGRRLTYVSRKDGKKNLAWKFVDGSGTVEQFYSSDALEFPTSWSPDGGVLAFSQYYQSTTYTDIWTLSLGPERKAQPFLQSRFRELEAVFSPDGQWLAYCSRESGRDQVNVVPFPGPGGKTQVSIEGGGEPVWARSGRELFYRNGDKMMAVAVTTKGNFSAEKPRVLFESKFDERGDRTNYDFAPDGDRFVFVKTEQELYPTEMRVVLNWFEELKRRVPNK